MDQIAKRVAEIITESGFVGIEVSTVHVYLTVADFETLFGKGAELHSQHALSQPGQYLCEEYVNLIGPKGRINHVAVYGPLKAATRISVAWSESRRLGVDAPVCERGELDGAGTVMIEGPCGCVETSDSVIIEHDCIYAPIELAEKNGLKNWDRVNVKVLSERPITFNDVVVYVGDVCKFRMYIDIDEAAAAGVRGFTLGKILK
jgi:putative phosphotransacetylase